MPFCYAPWTNIDIDTLGNMSPCCKFQNAQPLYNIKNNTLNEYKDNKILFKIKEEFLNNQWPVECERCRIEEDNGILSKRQLDYTRWKNKFNEYNLSDQKFLTADIAFGNTCNLTCITCNSYSSSRWHQEDKKINNIDIKPNHFYKSDFIEDFARQAPDLIHIGIVGGEPFLSGTAQQKQFLANYVASGQSKNMTLHYTTNATIFPETEWWDIWQHFQEIDIQLSIDGIATKFEYIRYPANWNDVNANIQLYKQKQVANANIKLSVSHTVSAYNIYYLDEFFTWCQLQALPVPWCGRVHTPTHMRPSVWPSSAKKYIIEHLSKSRHPGVLDWMNLLLSDDDSIMFNQFRIKLHEHDQYRKLNFGITFPEMAGHI